jgi:site-specific recombinase XerD
MNAITFSQAVDGYLLYAGARRLSQNTINDYTNTFGKFARSLENDRPISEITRHDISRFLAMQGQSLRG